MPENGWIKLHRKIKENWLWENDKPFDKRSAWIDILLMVNHKDNKILFDNELIKVSRGERITSERKLAEKWGWSRTKVRNFLDLLEKDNMIKVEKTTKKTTLKVVNFGRYQNRKTGESTTEVPEKDQASTRRVPGENTNKNDKECIKNDKNKRESDKSDNDSANDEPKYNQNSKPYKAAIKLKKLIKENNARQPVPDNDPKDMEKWSTAMDRLNRLGPPGGDAGYKWGEIDQLIEWCQQDEFWSGNILSAPKFREKIVKLENRMKKTTNNSGKGEIARAKEQANRHMEKTREWMKEAGVGSG